MGLWISTPFIGWNFLGAGGSHWASSCCLTQLPRTCMELGGPCFREMSVAGRNSWLAVSALAPVPAGARAFFWPVRDGLREGEGELHLGRRVWWKSCGLAGSERASGREG
jgi:hypothetical protein